MADGERTLSFDSSLVEKLERKAAEVGSTPEALAAFVLEQHLFNHDDYEWNEDPRTFTPDGEDEAGPTYPAADVLAEFDRRVKERLAAKS
jgi:hypothetical protein